MIYKHTYMYIYIKSFHNQKFAEVTPLWKMILKCLVHKNEERYQIISIEIHLKA